MLIIFPRIKSKNQRIKEKLKNQSLKFLFNLLGTISLTDRIANSRRF